MTEHTGVCREAQTGVDQMGHSRLVTPQVSHLTLPVGVQSTAGAAMPGISSDDLSPAVTPQATSHSCSLLRHPLGKEAKTFRGIPDCGVVAR